MSIWCSDICEIKTCFLLQVGRRRRQVLRKCGAYLHVHKDCKVSPILGSTSKNLIVTFNRPKSLIHKRLIIIIIIIP
jgi:hypothetical protein